MQHDETNGKTRKVYTLSHLEEICRQKGISPDLALQMKATAYVFPFKANSYVIDELIDWKDIPNDPIYKLLFPQPDMLHAEDGRMITSAVARKASTADLAEAIYSLREKYLPTDTEDGNPGVPVRNGKILKGYMKLNPGTLV